VTHDVGQGFPQHSWMPSSNSAEMTVSSGPANLTLGTGDMPANPPPVLCLMRVLDAACQAPSMLNCQPWAFALRSTRIELHIDPDMSFQRVIRRVARRGWPAEQPWSICDWPLPGTASGRR